ncbi:hypothetical protein HYDPIDRAFT_117328 [Hydnomerulius pinastri MD-312]|uniref:WD40 repeat-like protein n=1 Tax=Hydnomerulius pinastri MD-312 TaxID=994086 RepID=A0A0C9V4H9_9AGAM|nr:hypothetical protein HYDPIDRAFT_117328 [Hydnomerulius pinastri MD-312]
MQADAENPSPEHRPVKTFSGHEGRVWSIAFHPDGKQLVSCAEDNFIRIWDLETGEEDGKPLEGQGKVMYNILLLPDLKRLANGGGDTMIRIWDLESREVVAELRGHTDSVRWLDVSPDGRYLASGSFDTKVIIWDLDTGSIELDTMSMTTDIYFVKFSQDGTKLLAGSNSNGGMSIWDWRSGELLVGPIDKGNETIRSVIWLKDDEELLCASSKGTLRRWDALTGNPIGEPFRAHEDTLYYLTMSGNGKYLATASGDDTVKVWDAETLEQLVVLPHDGDANYVTFSPDDKFLASACDDKQVYLWDLSQMEAIKQTDNASFLDLPAVISDQETTARAGGQNESLTIEELLDFPATSRPLGNRVHEPSGRDSKPAPKRRFLDRFKFRRPPKSQTDDGGVELQGANTESWGGLRVIKVAAAKSKKFIMVVGNGPRRRSAEPEPNEAEDDEDEETSDRGDPRGAVEESESDSDSDSVHGCCWRCCHWVCYEMVTCYL